MSDLNMVANQVSENEPVPNDTGITARTRRARSRANDEPGRISTHESSQIAESKKTADPPVTPARTPTTNIRRGTPWSTSRRAVTPSTDAISRMKKQISDLQEDTLKQFSNLQTHNQKDRE